MKKWMSTVFQKSRSTKIITAFVVVASVAAIGTTSVAAASPSFFNVPKPTSQKICYAQYGGEGWQAAGFISLDHCLRYVSTKAPTAVSDCNHGYWYVWGFNSWDQCANWVVQHGGSGYAGDPNERF